MPSPITFSYDFQHRGSSNYRRGSGYAPILNTNRFRTPRTIVSRLSRFYESKRGYREAKKRNMRRERRFQKRTS